MKARCIPRETVIVILCFVKTALQRDNSTLPDQKVEFVTATYM